MESMVKMTKMPQLLVFSATYRFERARIGRAGRRDNARQKCTRPYPGLWSIDIETGSRGTW